MCLVFFFASSEKDYFIPPGVGSVARCVPTSGCSSVIDHKSGTKIWDIKVLVTSVPSVFEWPYFYAHKCTLAD